MKAAALEEALRRAAGILSGAVPAIPPTRPARLAAFIKAMADRAWERGA